MKALLIVDVQYDFLPGGALEVKSGDQIIPVINRLQDRFDLVVATQDWHPQDHGSFATNHEGKKPFDEGELDGESQIMWPDHCVQGSPGAELSKELEANRIEAIFRKGTDPKIDSYSGFYDNQHKKSTGLADYLKGRGVGEVYVTGLAGDFCVFFTTKDAVQEGFKTVLVEDATRPLDLEKFEKLKKELIAAGGSVVKAESV